MENIEKTYTVATGGHGVVQDDWLSPSALRSLVYDDPCLLWLKHYGHLYGFEEDPVDGSFLEYIMAKGCEFEAAWVKNCAPESEQCIADDKDVRKASSVWRTLLLMQARLPVITKAALWWVPSNIYGTADVLCLTSWLRSKYPELQLKEATDEYCVIDIKFTTKLETPSKYTDYAVYSNQVRLYSYMLGHLQTFMPRTAFIISRDTLSKPIAIDVKLELNHPLDAGLSKLINDATDIKFNGASYTPWADSIVKPNFANDHDQPWTSAKEIIGLHLMQGRPLEWLPYVGKKQAGRLRASGIQSIDDLLCLPIWESLDTLNGGKGKQASRIKAVLEANRTGTPSLVPENQLPHPTPLELFCDFEFLSNLNIQWEHEWPALHGCPMVFMVGVGWEINGQFCYRQFTAVGETHAAEKQMFEEFLSFLSELTRGRNYVLYHWSHAENIQAKQASTRTGLVALETLPFYDLQEVVLNIPIALPDCWNFGLKSFATAIGSYNHEFKTDWPNELQSGLSAMCLGWSAFASEYPLESSEMQILSKYLRVDCLALYNVLRWLRYAASVNRKNKRVVSGWYNYSLQNKDCKVHLA